MAPAWRDDDDDTIWTVALVDFARYSRIPWKGMMGNKPYPAVATGIDRRQNGKDLVARHRWSLKQEAAQEPKTVRD